MADISIVIPVFNERENLPHVYRQVVAEVGRLDRPFEILFVDDGSRDGSAEQIEALARVDGRVRAVLFRRNYGQTAAMQAGLQYARGDIIVTMDADQQNDPADIAMMIEKLEEGYDVVHGWRRDRQDPWLSRRLPSQLANWVIARATGFPIHDLGCTLKAMRSEIAQEIELYGEMHRFIPILAHQRGARCVEVATRHRPRTLGESKYGISRTLRVVLDLITVKYLLDYFASPMKLFGIWGIGATLLGGLSAMLTTVMKLAGGVDVTGNPLFLSTIFCWMAGMQFFSLGLLGEVAARIYYTAGQKQNYAIRRRVNFEECQLENRAA